jgi:type II secretion system protein N
MTRTLRIVAVIVAAVLLTSFFVYLGFPYDRLGEYLSSKIEQATGTRLTFGRLDSKLFLLGPGLVAEDVGARTASGDVWSFQRLAARPAWSMAWLQGRPAFYLDAAAPFGELRGVAVVGEPYAFDGEATGVDLAGVPLDAILPEILLEGTADIVADVVLEGGQPRGPLQLTAKEGTLGHPSLPLTIPYETITGGLNFGGEHAVLIDQLDIQSPMGTGTIRGNVGQSPVPANAALDLQIDMQAGGAIRAAFSGMGVKFGEDGTLSVKVTGTVSRPLVR